MDNFLKAVMFSAKKYPVDKRKHRFDEGDEGDEVEGGDKVEEGFVV